jgi:antitoxin component HigA of HigAB toxin-antitoxin module
MPNILDDRKKTADDLANAIRMIDTIYQNKNNNQIIDALLLVVLNTLGDAEEHIKKEVKDWTIYYKKRDFEAKLEAEMNGEEDSSDE